MADTTILEGLVIKITEYQEFDEIITIYSRLGKLAFIALGVRRINSKNKRALQIGNWIECEIFLARLKNKLSKLKKAHIIYQLDISDNRLSFFYRKFLFYLHQIDTRNYFQYLLNWKEQMESKKYNVVLTWHLNKMLNFLGYQQSSQSCIKCHSKFKIASYNFQEGGLLCENHLQNNSAKPRELVEEFVVINQLKILDYLKAYLPIQQSILLKDLEAFWKTINEQ